MALTLPFAGDASRRKPRLQGRAASAGVGALRLERAPTSSVDFRLNIPAPSEPRNEARRAGPGIDHRPGCRRVGRSRQRLPHTAQGLPSRSPRSAATRSICTRANTTRRAGRDHLRHRYAQGGCAALRSLVNRFAPSPSPSACNTACRSASSSTPSYSLSSIHAGPVTGNDSIRSATSILDYVCPPRGAGRLLPWALDLAEAGSWAVWTRTTWALARAKRAPPGRWPWRASALARFSSARRSSRTTSSSCPTTARPRGPRPADVCPACWRHRPGPQGAVDAVRDLRRAPGPGRRRRRLAPQPARH